MRTILFFDDWSLQDYRSIQRRWFNAERWTAEDTWHDPLLRLSWGSSVLRDPHTRSWRMWGGGTNILNSGDEGLGTYLWDSPDGLEWKACLQDPPVHQRADTKVSHMVFGGEFSGCGAVFLDEREPDAHRRYKMTYSDLSANPVDSSYGTCRVAVSPDGVHWSIDRGAVWRWQHTDGGTNALYNPCTGKYQFINRPILGDRRMALYQTRDWKTFDPPFVVIHPDPFDPPFVEFYGMPTFFYEGYFIGFLWKQHGAPTDRTIASRMKGTVDAELVYSINGIQWNRTTRTSFLPDRGLGKDGFRMEYPFSLVQDEEGWLRTYTNSYLCEHASFPDSPPELPVTVVTTARWRQDGFCALEADTDIGDLTLRPLVARGGEILLNAITAPFGKIRAELRTVPDDQPAPGFELENSIPINGDGTRLPLRWKERANLDSIQGAPFRLYLELEQARVYAIRLNCDLLYGWVPQVNFAGDYIPDCLPGLKPGIWPEDRVP